MTKSPIPVRTRADQPRDASVLIVDDSPAIRAALTHTLGTLAMFSRIETAEDGFSAYQALVARPFDVVLCDLNMPRCNGLAFLRLRASNQQLRGVPIIVLTGSVDDDNKVAALELGASDYVSKVAAPAELAARIALHVRLKQAHDELLLKTAELERLCNTDALTGLYNRRFVRETLDAELGRAARYGRPMSLVLLDVDHFKRVNDTYGHPAGDHVLIRLGSLLQQTVRKCDVAARFGGEEMAIVLPETGLHGAGLLAERLRRAIVDERFEWEGQRMPVTASFGVASLSAAQGDTVDGLIRAADRALYSAKRRGRNAVVMAGADTGPITPPQAHASGSLPD